MMEERRILKRKFETGNMTRTFDADQSSAMSIRSSEVHDESTNPNAAPAYSNTNGMPFVGDKNLHMEVFIHSYSSSSFIKNNNILNKMVLI